MDETEVDRKPAESEPREQSGPHKLTALIVDDDEDFRSSVAALASREGFETFLAASLEEARKAISSAPPDVVLVDLKLPDGSGTELLAETDVASDTEFIVLTGNATIDTAVEAIRDGALDYLTKPFERARLVSALANVTRMRRTKRELQSLRGELRRLGHFGRLIGRSAPMQEVYNLIARVAPTMATVLVVGESGTGKELVAETVHALSRRSDRPFCAVNCGAIAPNLIESELFGHEKGSFTGADRRRAGHFERAAGGTLFLDEITEMPLELQVKLLRVLESGRFLRVGANEPIEADVRIVAATNRDPLDAVSSGVLREDLYYRLSVFPITLPPLRDRGEDVEQLAQHFLDELNRAEGTEKRWGQDALNAVTERTWRGNVRELRNAVQRAFILADDEIDQAAIRVFDPIRDDDVAPGSGDERLEMLVGSEIAAVEKRLILATLDHCGGDKTKAAQMLGISLKTLYNRLARYRIEDAGSP